jgi:hypothetical protein
MGNDGLIERDDRGESFPVDDPALVAIELHAAEPATLVEVADRVGLELGLLGKSVLAKSSARPVGR